jgi:type II secretory pathway predicted ATPase ExeA
MYEASFKFHSRPFPPTPQSGTYFPARAIERARETLVRVIERGEGPGLVTGAPGTGKTLLCHLLAEAFGDRFAVVLLAGGRLKSSRAMLQAILYELGLPYRDLNEGELRLSLLDFLEPKPGGSQGLLLLVDEAHALPWRLLDELRLMTNLVRDGQPRVRVILAGAPALEERFNGPKLESFSQRLAGRCYLEPLNRAETAAYVRAQIAVAGGDAARLVDDETLASVYRVTEGIPRLINQVCDHALLLASLGGHRRLASGAIDEAWADLQQLPPPWTGPADKDASSHIVEFGDLEDDGGETRQAIPFRSAEKKLVAEPLEARAPEDQLEAIADQLSAIEESDDAAGADATAADLDFPEFGDPFQERFAEEEVVVDPYSSDVEIFADVPRVSSWESRQIASLLDEVDALAPVPANTQRPNVRINEPAREEAAVEPGFVPASDPVLPEGPVPASTPGAAPLSTAEPMSQTNPQPLEKLAGAANDRDLIVLEEDVPPKVPAAGDPARKGEFRQLFSKLRRG